MGISNGKEYIPLFLDFNETTQDLTDEECGRLIRAIVAYANDEEYEHHLTGGEKIAFRFLKGVVDRNEALSEKRSQARKNKTKQNETNDNKQEQNESNENKEEQNESNSLTKTKNKTKKENKTKNQKETSPQFDRFWNAYPRHENKQGAMRAFDKAHIDGELLETILTAIERQKASPQWQENGGQFIPHPATWLNGHRWEDEVRQGTPMKSVNAQQYGQRDYSGEQDDAMKRMLKLQEGA